MNENEARRVQVRIGLTERRRFLKSRTRSAGFLCTGQERIHEKQALKELKKYVQKHMQQVRVRSEWREYKLSEHALPMIGESIISY
jgi:hypothetical protein